MCGVGEGCTCQAKPRGGSVPSVILCVCICTPEYYPKTNCGTQHLTQAVSNHPPPPTNSNSVRGSKLCRSSQLKGLRSEVSELLELNGFCGTLVVGARKARVTALPGRSCQPPGHRDRGFSHVDNVRRSLCSLPESKHKYLLHYLVSKKVYEPPSYLSKTFE